MFGVMFRLIITPHGPQSIRELLNWSSLLYEHKNSFPEAITYSLKFYDHTAVQHHNTYHHLSQSSIQFCFSANINTNIKSGKFRLTGNVEEIVEMKKSHKDLGVKLEGKGPNDSRRRRFEMHIKKLVMRQDI